MTSMLCFAKGDFYSEGTDSEGTEAFIISPNR
jgi:hypothetical protein